MAPLDRQRSEGVDDQRPERRAHPVAGAHGAAPARGAARRLDAVLHAIRPRARARSAASTSSGAPLWTATRSSSTASRCRRGRCRRGWPWLLPPADGLNPERIVIALEAVGIGQWAVEYAARSTPASASSSTGRSARTRRSPIRWRTSGPSSKQPSCSAYKAAWLFDHGQPCGAEANAAKLLGARPAFARATSRCRPSAASATRARSHVERLWREVRLYAIAPITQEMVLNYLAEHVLGLPKSY